MLPAHKERISISACSPPGLKDACVTTGRFRAFRKAALNTTRAQLLDAIAAPCIHGAWRLVSYLVEEKTSGDTFKPMGDQPTGYALFTPEGRVSFTLTAEGRTPTTDREGDAALLSSLVAYSGTYRLEDDRWITAVDVAWKPEWVGTEQMRFFAIDGDQLTVRTPWRVMPNWPKQGPTRSLVIFRRCS